MEQRIIKFRAWDKTRNKLWPTLLVAFDFGHIQVNDKGEDVLLEHGDYELMQFTGLKDRNGVEVYEGDIVNCSNGCSHEVVFMSEVPSTNIGGMPGFYLQGLNQGYAWTGSELVVGNIYENPELTTL